MDTVAPASNDHSKDRDVNSLVVGIIAGAIGMAYFIYGKRQ